ncbi:ABC transporter substrate-binding protein [Butyrivibrio sp. AE3006]|uniref:ABC transporter substrate-binding protein n=1 Tax=Butyrivibrio sp. AE3006 TaxID=1280673 RepID=UPI000407B4B7|nr:ABC transporter substrate-binding protein [Butyrivibrio sp. AE3006]
MRKIICSILVLSVLSLTACGSKAPEEAKGEFSPSLDTNTECSLTVAGSYDNFEALEAEFDRFNEIYPNVQLNYVKLDDYNNVLNTALEGDDKPNIFFTFASMVDDEKYSHIFTHTEDLSDSALGLNLGCIREGLIYHDDENHVMMVPVFSRSYGMLVNNDLFEKEGLKVPTTWNELLDVCEKFKSKGYANPMMGYSAGSSSCFMYTVAYPMFIASLAEKQEALDLANKLDPAAGEYMRPALEAVENLVQSGCIDIAECDKIEDNYTEVILRFFEGDVPMMICSGDTVSGTRKRETQSEAFSQNPFSYTFSPIPLTDKGGYFIDSPSVEFSVNKECENLDMTNEFMRFLITNKELDQMASVKRLVTPTSDLSFDAVYAPFGQVPADRTISPEVIGITDPLTVQIKGAAYQVGKGEITIDDAVSMYGTFE